MWSCVGIMAVKTEITGRHISCFSNQGKFSVSQRDMMKDDVITNSASLYLMVSSVVVRRHECLFNWSSARSRLWSELG